jgi:hypothetical protein
MRDGNRIALAKVDIGMTKTQVIGIMGDRTATEAASGTYTNPFKRETIKGVDGKSYDVLFYYTQQIGNSPIETGLTPIAFLENKVVGIGWGYLDAVSGNSTSTIRRR